MEPRVLSQSPITTAELKAEIVRIVKRDKTPNIRVTKLEEYLNFFVEASAERAEELKKKLEKLSISRLRPEHICKIIDIMPKTPEELKIALQGYAISLPNESLNKIAETINEFLEKK